MNHIYRNIWSEALGAWIAVLLSPMKLYTNLFKAKEGMTGEILSVTA